MMYLINEILMMAMILIVAKIHADWFDLNKPTTWFFHAAWATPFVLQVLFYVTVRHEYVLALALALERFVFFNQALNYFRIPRKPFFYLGTTKKNESFTDIVLEALDNAYPYLWGVALILWVICNVKLFL